MIENTQRDVNIALINELALIFNKMGIDTEAVLQAAGTKWNFLPFRPGLVGGHCIGVDPYYLDVYKRQRQRAAHGLDQAGMGELQRRDVDGDGPVALSSVDPLAHLAAGFVDDPFADRQDQSGLFRSGDELVLSLIHI